MSAKEEAHQKWLMCSKIWSCYNEMKQEDTEECNTIQPNQCFANRNEDDEIYPLTVKEIEEAQKADNTLKQYFKSNAVLDNGLELLLIENESCICHKGRLRNTEALAKSCSYVVPPLSSAPWAYPSRRDNESCDILERNEKHHPIQNEVMQDLPSE